MAAALILPLFSPSATAASSSSLPRAALMRMTPSFIWAMVSALMSLVVDGLSAAWRVM